MMLQRAFTPGDAIGLFYRRGGEWFCGGYGTWTGNSLQITVYGDDNVTTLKDGFAVGETYTYKLWDSKLAVEHSATATYTSGPDNYQKNGFSILSGLTTGQTYDLNMTSSWNLVSSYINPSEPALETLMAPIVSNLVIMKNGTGSMYVPAYGINTIGSWNVLSGYYIYLNAASVLTIAGTQVRPENTPISLISGWNMISYLRNSPLSVETALSGVANTLVLAKNGLGNLYVPAYGVNTIGNMMPGIGYYVYMSAADDLIYPANGSGRLSTPDELTPQATRLIPEVGLTGSSAVLLVNTQGLKDGDELGVWTEKGMLVGSGRVNNDVTAISIWGDNEMTKELDGAIEGETLTVKFLDSKTGTRTAFALSGIKEITQQGEVAELRYMNNGIYRAKGVVLGGNEFELSVKVMPNPINGTSVIEYTINNDSRIKLELIDMKGSVIWSSVEGACSTGIYSKSLDCRDIPNGTYELILHAGMQTATTRVVILK